MTRKNAKAEGTAKPARGRAQSPRRDTAKKPRTTAFVPTGEQRQLVSLAKLAGHTDRQVAAMINYPEGIALNTLKKHFKVELEGGRDAMMLRVVGNLFAMATNPQHKSAATAAIWLTKQHLGWTDKGAGSVSAEAEVQDGAGAKLVRFTLNIGEPQADNDEDE